jgi:Flp pilus assembly pilin Flp
MVETALILLFASIAAVAAVLLIGPAVSSVFQQVADAPW